MENCGQRWKQFGAPTCFVQLHFVDPVKLLERRKAVRAVVALHFGERRREQWA